MSVNSLPNELLKTILDAVPLHEKFCVAAVGSRWRRIVQDDGVFRLQMLVPRLLLRAWLGSADDDPSRGGLQLDLSRPVKLTLASINQRQTPVTENLDHTGQTARLNTENQNDETIVWARAVPNNVEALVELVESEGSGGAALLTLVGRIPRPAAFVSWDVTKSLAGCGTLCQSLDKLVTGLGIGMLPRLENLRAKHCNRLSWVTAPLTLRHLVVSECANLKFLQVLGGTNHVSQLHSLDLSCCLKIDPVCLPAVLNLGRPGTACDPVARLPLQYLGLSWLTHVPQTIVSGILERCPDLQRGYFHGIAGFEVMAALKRLSCLKFANLAYNDNVLPADLWEILHHNQDLTKLVTRGCKAISIEQSQCLVSFTWERLRTCNKSSDMSSR